MGELAGCGKQKARPESCIPDDRLGTSLLLSSAMSASFKPFSEKPEDTTIFRINLPHWRQAGVTYFVTWRLGDSLPQGKLKQHEASRLAWLQAHGLRKPDELDSLPEEKRHEYHARFTAELHRWLDASHGACVLKRPGCAETVAGALRHFDGERYLLDGFVVMPNHVHLLVVPHSDWPLSKVLHSWKSFTSHELNRSLGRDGPLWQQESWDHIVRSGAQLEHYRRYITENPVKAKLRVDEFVLGCGLGLKADEAADQK